MSIFSLSGRRRAIVWLSRPTAVNSMMWRIRIRIRKTKIKINQSPYQNCQVAKATLLSPKTTQPSTQWLPSPPWTKARQQPLQRPTEAKACRGKWVLVQSTAWSPSGHPHTISGLKTCSRVWVSNALQESTTDVSFNDLNLLNKTYFHLLNLNYPKWQILSSPQGTIFLSRDCSLTSAWSLSVACWCRWVWACTCMSKRQR